MRRYVRPLLLVALFTGSAAIGRSQGPAGADTLSAAAVTDSQAVLRTLDTHVRANPRDAAAWHRRGLIAWALADRARAANPPRVLDATLLGRLADTSLRIAAELEPQNSRYRFMVARYLLQSGVSITRVSAYQHFDRALELARASGHAAEHADAAVEVGRVYWRRYDAQADRWLEPDELAAPMYLTIEQAVALNPITMLDTTNPRRLPPEVAIKQIHSRLLDQQAIPDVGDADYLRSEALFREAREIAPAHSRSFRQLAMLLAERKRWNELRDAAAEFIGDARGDHWGWLALGLAYQRTRNFVPGRAAFDSALVRMTATERARLSGLRRLLRPSDTLAYMRADSATQAGQERMYWQMADPLWARPENDAYPEFLARVTFADLRWTVEELNVRGADSDRGDIHVRHGPADVIATFIPRAFGTVVKSPIPDWYPDVVAPPQLTVWSYHTGLLVIFWSHPTFATASFPLLDQENVTTLLDLEPARWDNVSEERIETMPVQTARFRAPGDSVDLYLASRGPVAAIRDASASNTVVQMDAWLMGRDVPDTYRDSAALEAHGVHAWAYRLRPSMYMYRVEATAPDVLVAGRAMAWILAGPDTATGFATRGPGLSDLVLAASARSRDGTPRGWRDFAITPLLGSVATRGSLDVLWENYELGASGGRARYDVEIVVERARGTVGRIAAQIVGGIAGAVGVDRRDDRLTLRFERDVLHAAVVVDHITMNVGETPPGEYRLTVRVSDRAANRSVARTSSFTIR